MPVYPGPVIMTSRRGGHGGSRAKVANYRSRMGIGGLGALGQTPEIDARRAELENLRAERLSVQAEIEALRSGVPVQASQIPVAQPAPSQISSAQSASQGQGLLRAQGSIEVGGGGSTASTYSGAAVAGIAAGVAVIYFAFFRRRR